MMMMMMFYNIKLYLKIPFVIWNKNEFAYPGFFVLDMQF